MADDRYHRAAPRGSACTGWQNFECFGVPNGVSVFGSPPQVLNRPSCSSSFWKRHCPTHLGTAATAGACTWFHIDSNGLGASILLKCGLKIWIFLRDDEGKVCVINCFQDFELDEANGYQLEVIVPRPGTRMYVDYLPLPF